MKTYVLDACSLIAYINDERGAEVTDTLIRNSRKGKCEVYMHQLNYLEVYIDVARTSTIKQAEKLRELITDLNIHISYDLSEKIVKEAATLKAKFKISLADSVLLAFAKTIKAEVVSSDHHEFDIIESTTKIKFKWIR
ncbi:MAG: hypothetical protein RLZZ367_1254 [Bacteroidota bacterium]|jgi:predicted nucleic acid-binding protein